ncbi:hypothetical protein [Blastococcus sp. SYSU D00820]
MHPAADDPPTRAALVAYRGGSLRWLLGGSVAVVLAVLLAVAAVTIAENGGRRVPLAGTVVAVLVLGGLVAAGAGLGALVRSRRWERALAGTAWQTGVLRVAGPALLTFVPEGTDEWDPDDATVRLQLQSTTLWRTRAVQQLDGAEVRAAPVGGRSWVLTAEGSETLYGARERRRGR